MAPTRKTLTRASTEPALPTVSLQALRFAARAQKKELRRSATRQHEKFARRPGLSAVEEDEEIWWDADPVPYCSAQPKPYVDVVQKKHPKLRCFEDRVLLVESGWLYWSTDMPARQPSLAKLHKKRWRACVDLASTPCRVKEVDGSDTLFILEPLTGCRWSSNDVHSRVGKTNAFVFKARSPQERDNWMRAIYQHMEYAILPPAPCMPVKPGMEFSSMETCSVCLGAMLEASSICKTPCDHTFHSQCLHQWLAVDNTCPCCRSLLCRPPRRPLQRMPERLPSLPFQRGSTL